MAVSLTCGETELGVQRVEVSVSPCHLVPFDQSEATCDEDGPQPPGDLMQFQPLRRQEGFAAVRGLATARRRLADRLLGRAGVASQTGCERE